MKRRNRLWLSMLHRRSNLSGRGKVSRLLGTQRHRLIAVRPRFSKAGYGTVGGVAFFRGRSGGPSADFRSRLSVLYGVPGW